MSRELSWRIGFAEFDRLVDRRLDEVQRGAALLTAEAVKTGLPRFGLPGTPVDTSFARNSWRVGVNAAPAYGPSRNPNRKAPAPDVSLEPALAVVTAGDEVIIGNHAEYIEPLEYGRSSQAPQGFVRLTVAAFPRIVNAVARRLGVAR